MNQIARMTDTSLDAVKAKLAGGEGRMETLKPIKRSGPVEEPGANQPEAAYQDNLLAVLVAYPGTRHHLGGFDTGMFVGGERQKLAEWLKRHDKPLTDVPAALLPLETYVKIVQLKGRDQIRWLERTRQFARSSQTAPPD